VLVNLIGNRDQVLTGRPVVSPWERRAGRANEVRFFVRDEGQGIPADKLVELVFERFPSSWTPSDSRHRERYGARASRSAGRSRDRHEGRIWARERGRPRQACLPCSRSPLLSDDHRSGESVGNGDEPSSSGGDPMARNEIRRLLESSGLMILECRDVGRRSPGRGKPTAARDPGRPGNRSIASRRPLATGDRASDRPQSP